MHISARPVAFQQVGIDIWTLSHVRGTERWIIEKNGDDFVHSCNKDKIFEVFNFLIQR